MDRKTIASLKCPLAVIIILLGIIVLIQLGSISLYASTRFEKTEVNNEITNLKRQVSQLAYRLKEQADNITTNVTELLKDERQYTTRFLSNFSTDGNVNSSNGE